MDSSFVYPTLATAIATLWLSSYVYKAWREEQKLRHIPAVGPTGVFASWIGAFKYISNAHEMIEEGYTKYRGTAFRVPTINKWIVVVSGASKVDEIRKAADDHVSFQEAIGETLQTKYTIGEKVDSDPYHVTIVRTPLTRNIGARFEDVQDEISESFADLLPATEEWTGFNVHNTAMKITCRSSNRLFVDVPLCRDEDYIDLNIKFTIDVVKASYLINLFPNFLKPLAGRLFTNTEHSIRRGMNHLAPIIQERLEMDERLGKDHPDRPNDMISWLLEYAEGYQRTVRDVTLRILAINLAAIHTTSMTFTQVLFALADHPEYIPELREEIEKIIQEEGVTKLSLLRLVKCDSFIKETQRINGLGALTMNRKAMKNFTFSDGVFIPQGVHIAIPNFSMHHDEEYYSNPTSFDGFRFAKRINEVDGFNKHSMVSLGLDYIIFGHGRHACPGRFFVVNELKAFLAHFLMHYDIQLDSQSPPLQGLWFGDALVPNPKATLMVRKRRV